MRAEVGPWLSIVGIGEDGLAGLSPAARTLVDNAEILIGGERHLAMVPPNGSERRAWPSPIDPLVEEIPSLRGRRVCVLATGDPMFFGIGGALARRLDVSEMLVVPALSAFSLAAARLGWPLESAALLTLQGRAVETLSPHISPGARLLILAHDRRSPRQVTALLATLGFGESVVTVLAHMGGEKEARVSARAAAWSADVPDFHTLAVECAAGPGAVWHPRTGLPDDAFAHDGKLTKREVRAAALARLMPHPGALMIDVGAGCGSIAVEWMRAERNARAIAIEPRADRRALIAQNACALGVPGLDIRDGSAPDALTGLSEPDAILIGGGLSGATIAASQQKLKPGGRLVAHAVTLESEALLLSAYAQHGGELTRLSVERAEAIGGFSAWRPMLPVTQWAWRKR
jgi:precorrin-6Y C5,15-methyltransferase (decarboxylating)